MRYCRLIVLRVQDIREHLDRPRSVTRSLARLLPAFCLLAVGGCASTAAVVKETLKDQPLLANAFSRAVSFGTEPQKKPKPEPSAYPQVPIEENSPRVRQFIKQYGYAHRETMKTYLTRGRNYLPMVKAMTKENGLPEELAYLCLLESGANPEARSPANALGMWQFMPETARSYGLRVDSWVDERLDPRRSTKAAMLYLKDLYGMFGCWRLALSAYNSGENKLNKVLCQEDAEEYDEICSSKRLKRETKEFYPRYQAIAHIASNPTKFGFPEHEAKTEENRIELVPVEGSYSLDTLAEAVGVKADELAEMNPALVRNQTPSGGPPYSLAVPLGKRRVLAKKLQDMEPEASEGHFVHVVGKGDNIGRICQRYGIDKKRLAEINPDVNLRRALKRGAKILVPGRTTGTAKTAVRKRHAANVM